MFTADEPRSALALAARAFAKPAGWFDRHVAGAIIGLHVYFWWAYGATFWVDGASYIRLAQAWNSIESFRSVFDGPSLWWHNYAGSGLPLAWVGLRRLPESAVWPLWSGLQHALAAFALIQLVSSLRRLLHSRIFALAAVLLCVTPAYQGVHNNFLTESIASSLLVLGLAVAAAPLAGDRNGETRLWPLLALALAASLFRSNVAIALGGLAALAVWRQRGLFTRGTLVVMMATLVAFHWFSAVRALITHELIPPRPGPSSLVLAPRVNLAPSSAAMEALRGVEWPPGVDINLVAKGQAPFDAYEKAARLWRSQGLSNNALLERFERLGAAVRHDGLEVEVRALKHAAVSAGFNVPCLEAAKAQFSVAMTNDEACKIHRYYWRVFSGLEDSAQYVERHMRPSFGDVAVPELQQFYRAWRLWLVEHHPRLKDPLALGWLDPTMALLAGIMGAALLLFRLPWLGVAILAMPLGNTLLHAVLPIAGIRYAIPFVPEYIMAPALAFAALRRGRCERPPAL